MLVPRVEITGTPAKEDLDICSVQIYGLKVDYESQELAGTVLMPQGRELVISEVGCEGRITFVAGEDEGRVSYKINHTSDLQMRFRPQYSQVIIDGGESAGEGTVVFYDDKERVTESGVKVVTRTGRVTFYTSEGWTVTVKADETTFRMSLTDEPED